ncbi:fibropellin-3-like [Strongylocentrotus purpuratus]|uniref:EGF-like domain-containing protein n=1 Tax=Strongylocentrotus purpuratus TaxID=7668 RepID=A0A7M7NKM6_STRPU|nr:fibropellin-3-like [Strongylocentrotus purpuratus]
MYSCNCYSGWTGVNCQINENECGSNPCTNGDCLDEPNMYSCNCYSGWTGVNCQIDIDDCSAEACANGGTCVDHLNAYTCECPKGFRGAICENDDPCASNPCMNDCSCSVVNDTTAVCTSDSVYITGTFCEQGRLTYVSF